MRKGEIIDRRRQRNFAYWKALMTKQYGKSFTQQQLDAYIRKTYAQSRDLMLGYQELGLEWWTKKDAKMAYYQTLTPILLVSLKDFLEELGNLIGKTLTTEDYTNEYKRELVYEQAQAVYEKYYKDKEINVIECEQNL